MDYQPSGNITARSEDSIILLERQGEVWIARVEFNNLHQAKLIVDTGETFTTISKYLAYDAGIQSNPRSSHVNLTTAGGSVKAKWALLQESMWAMQDKMLFMLSFTRSPILQRE